MSGMGGRDAAKRLGQCPAGEATKGAGDDGAAGSGDGEDSDGGELAATEVESGECCTVDSRCRCCHVN